MSYALGIELGSTRIKAVLIDENARVICQGSYEWENELVDGIWSYSLNKVEEGIQTSYSALNSAYKEKFGDDLREIAAVGVSAMMHGYMAFDGNNNLLVPFRTWRNTNTENAAAQLTELFGFNIPMRWSVAHYYQAILNKEEHVKNIAFLTTLSGYVHYKLTGKRVLGIGDASGMFPIKNNEYDKVMLGKFNNLLNANGIDMPFDKILPEVLVAGEDAGNLTDDGAKWLDVSGNLKSGCLVCPPEGDAGTGMVATNSIKPKTANVSAGTSAFLMAVLDKELSGCYKEIDVVATPSGSPVAMVHVNNFASEITAWANLFGEVIELSGNTMERGRLFDALYTKSLSGDENCGGMIGYNFLSGEPIAKVKSGIPMLVRTPDGKLNLANFMKMHIYSALGSLAIGCEILSKENVEIESVCGHGGFFKTPTVGQNAMSLAIGAPVTVMQNAGEGGAWGIAVLALFRYLRENSLSQFLEGIFKDSVSTTVSASDDDRDAFAKFMKKYKMALEVERLASEVL